MKRRRPCLIAPVLPSLGILLLSALLFFIFAGQGALSAENNQNTAVCPGVVGACPKGARLFAVPLLEPGKPAWVSVFDAGGTALSNCGVTVNGIACLTDNYGQANFTCPPGKDLVIALAGADGQAVSQCHYALTPGGLLASEPSGCQFFDRLSELGSSSDLSPTIYYAPALLEARQPFLIAGKNFGGQSDRDRIVVDDFDCDLFSGSTVSLLATAPRRLRLGPLRELYVQSQGESSRAVEVDICQVEARVSDDCLVPGRKTTARVRVIGTNFPALLEIENNSPYQMALGFEGKEIGQSATFITPGGEQNVVDLEMSVLAKGSAAIETHLVSDAPWSPEDKAIFADDSLRRLLAGLNKGQIIRLKRRLTALESRLSEGQESRRQLCEGPIPAAAETERLTAELRALSLRQRRITAMLNSRRVLLEALGGSDEDYRQALNLADGGSLSALQNCLQPGDPSISASALLADCKLERKTKSPTAGKQTMASKCPDRQAEKSSMSGKGDLVATIASLSRIWQKFPTRPPRSARLAPPPAPYAPNLLQLGPPDDTYQFTDLYKAGLPPSTPRQKRHVHPSRTVRSGAPGQADSQRRR